MTKGTFRKAGVAALSALVALVTFGVSPFAAPAAAQAQQDVPCARIFGQDRYETAAAIALETFGDTTTPTVLIARGDGTPTNPFGVSFDALSGAYGAGLVEGPILLTPGNGPLPDSTVAAIEDLGATEAVILGGPAAVSPSVEAELEAQLGAANVDRIGGRDRFETAYMIGSLGPVFVNAAGESSIFLASGDDAREGADALSAGPASYAEQIPILLTQSNSLNSFAAQFIDENDIDRVYVLGGTVAISGNVTSAITPINGGTQFTRIEGASRQGTAVQLAVDFLIDELGWETTHFNLANGVINHLIDALAGAPHGGEEEAMTLLTAGTDALGEETETFLEDLNDGVLQQHGGDTVQEPESAHILGGPAAINDETVNDACTLAGVPVTPPSGGEATALSLSPETSVNPVSTQAQPSTHTVTANLTDGNGNAALDETIRFEVYTNEDGTNDACSATGGASSSDCFVFDTGDVVESAGGEATFTYSSTTVRDDFIVACVVTGEAGQGANDPCTVDNPNTALLNEEGTLEIDRATGNERNVDNARLTDVVQKEWQARVAASLTLTPDSATNTFNNEHLVTATVRDQFGTLIEGQTVTFEVYRDFQSDNPDVGFTAEDTGSDTTTQEGQNTATTADDEAAGEATFSYTYDGASGNATDLIVACIEGADADTTCATLVDDDPNAISRQRVVVDADDPIADTANKLWVEPVVTALELSPDTDINPADGSHTVTANVIDQTGKPIDGETVTFEVFRRDNANDTTFTQVGAASADTTDAGGDAEFTYAGPGVNALDTIVACASSDCAVVTPSGALQFFSGQVQDTAQKTWVVTTAAAAGTFTGDVFGLDAAANELDVLTDNGSARRFLYEGTDVFTVNGDTVTVDEFEEIVNQALDSEASTDIRVVYDPTPFTSSRFEFTTDMEFAGLEVAATFTDISGTGNNLATVSNCDDCDEAVTMPFNFTFYGVSSNLLNVGANGYVQHGGSPGGSGTDFSNEDLPTAETGRSILPFWDDLRTDTSGDVFFETVGAVGSRQFIIQWQDVAHFSCGGASTFQIVLFEGTNNIQFNYQDTTFSDTGSAGCDAGESATVGLNRDATEATEYSFNEPVVPDGTSILFTQI